MKKILAIILALATVLTFSATAFAAPAGRITKAQAKQIALDHAGFTESEVRFTKAKLDFDNGIFEYDIEFYAGTVEYDYTIAAADGRIIEFDIDGQEPAAPANIIGRDEAKAIALKHAGVAESDACFIKVELDFDNGAYEYDVEFVAGKVEYDYTIAAADGKIIKVETENKGGTANPDAPANLITEAEAKAIALEHAGVAESEARFTKVKLEFDDGAYEYDIEFVANGTEYDYTVAAADGRVTDFDREPVEHHVSLSVLVRWIKDFFAAILA